MRPQKLLTATPPHFFRNAGSVERACKKNCVILAGYRKDFIIFMICVGGSVSCDRHWDRNFCRASWFTYSNAGCWKIPAELHYPRSSASALRASLLLGLIFNARSSCWRACAGWFAFW